jgi:hypothetical protein
MWFGIFAGVWGIAMVIVFILAIRLSYRIEARSEGLTNRSGIPRKAMMFHTVLNLKVSRDPETQAMRHRMLWLLSINAAGFVLLAVAIRLFSPENS